MNYQLITQTELFRGITQEDAKAMLHCLQAVERKYSKGSFIYRQGDKIEAAGVILSGAVHVVQNDIWGNQNLLANVVPGELFSETYACLPGQDSMVDVIAAKDCEILFLNTKKVLKSCSSACVFHSRLIQNLLSVLAAKNLELTQKIQHTAPKSIRERVLSYLSYQAMKQGKFQFEIPFSRQQFADYLCVDRSALSNELSKMQKEGVIEYKKNYFSLHKKEV
ncbi:MAG: Crp/Fnr family transcriptional regulator [Lachnospiraceae bacterium]|nr:Crp/Fnr family transcriptional regulator [Lachnospiraceae bacterium]